ncbi:MAG: DUF456 domain-containing protein [Bacteroidales bacterium]|nr:DUF456 domain-containing protein [Bacteroidales bacterium]
MQTTLIILAALCALVGLVGSVVPGLPGPPLSWVGLLLLNIAHVAQHSTAFMVVAAVVAVAITVIDNILPSLGTKRSGGSKAGIWGCNIGLVVAILGLPFGPQGLAGIIVWPFVGALVGEWLTQRKLRPALRAAWGAFTGFLAGTLVKLAYGVAALAIVVKDIVTFY